MLYDQWVLMYSLYHLSMFSANVLTISVVFVAQGVCFAILA